VRTSHLPALFAGCFLSAPWASAQQALTERELPIRFELLSDDGALGVVHMAVDAREEALAELGNDDLYLLHDLPLPGGSAVDLELRVVSALEAGAAARVIRPRAARTLSSGRLESRARCFSGRVRGGGTAFLGWTPDELHGYLEVDGAYYFLSSGPQPVPGLVTLTHAARAGRMALDFCALRSGSDGDGDRELASGGPTLRTAQVFIEADDRYRGLFASNQACLDYTVILLTAASEVYRRDVGVRLTIPDGYLRVWSVTPPWGAITSLSHLRNVYTWWQSDSNPLRGIPRAAVHVLTSPVIGGTARGTGGLCTTDRAYEISSLNGRFPYPLQHTARENWDLFVLCHEFGHTFGSIHSSDYSPPILCADGSGPDSGTLMSYCHTTYGIGEVGMRFHLREQQRIRNSLGSAGCLSSIALQRGDYDGDGDRDVLDLSAARTVRAQGFRSLGAEETLNMDGDLDLDDHDLWLLAELVYGVPPASVAFRNGSEINPGCLQALGNPVLDTDWGLRVLAQGAGSTTLVSGCAEPLSGVFSARGELLVRTPAQGGVRLFSSGATSDGHAAVHPIALPLDTSLIGLRVSFQGLVLDSPAGSYLCNALDAHFSLYE
jgi:hypothetical protein